MMPINARRSLPTILCFFLLASALLAPLALADHHESAAEGTDEMAGEMAPEMEAMMAAMEKAATPGAPHEMLATWTGSWNIEITAWMDPSAPPLVSTGTVERHMILGGRVLVETVNSSFMGEPFEGYGLTGFDNVTGEYWGTWNDTASTGIGLSTGTYDATTKTLTMDTTFSNPMGGKVQQRILTRDEGDRHVTEIYEDRGGEEVMSMKIVYTRQ